MFFITLHPFCTLVIKQFFYKPRLFAYMKSDCIAFCFVSMLAKLFIMITNSSSADNVPALKPLAAAFSSISHTLLLLLLAASISLSIVVLPIPLAG